MRTLSRRTLLKLGMVGGTGVLLGPQAASLLQAQAQRGARYLLNDPTRCIQTSCLQCNTGCPIKVKIQDGVAAKIDGNPVTPTQTVTDSKTKLKELDPERAKEIPEPTPESPFGGSGAPPISIQ